MQFDMETAPLRAEALEMFMEHWKPTPESEYVPLEKAVGRVTAETLYSKNTLPVCRVSACDGFAVKSADFADGIPDTSGWIRGKEYTPADTGDDFPDEYDTVIAVEDTDLTEGFRLIDGFEFYAGDNIRQAGSTIREGDLLMEANCRITPRLLALLACGGVKLVPVIRKPRIGFIPTGSELIPTGAAPSRGKNVECNGIMIEVIASEQGCEMLRFPIVQDDRGLLAETLDEAIKSCDIVIINGGSSRGGEDYNAELLQERSSFFHHGVRAVPGRPVGLSVIEGKAAFNFPGPTLAAWLACNWLLSAVVCRWYGLPMHIRQTVHAKMAEEIKKPPFFEMQCCLHLEKTEDGLSAVQIPRGAGNSLLRLMNGFMVLPVESHGVAAGETVEVELLTDRELI